MNNERIKLHKSAVSKKSRGRKNGSTEVFVLPPNILEKLGISLGSIQSTQDCPTNIDKETDTDVIVEIATCSDTGIVSKSTENNKITESVNETSILETANLMRSSVLLSPTFVPCVANVISGEVEIATTVNLFKETSKTGSNNKIGLHGSENIQVCEEVQDFTCKNTKSHEIEENADKLLNNTSDKNESTTNTLLNSESLQKYPKVINHASLVDKWHLSGYSNNINNILINPPDTFSKLTGMTANCEALLHKCLEQGSKKCCEPQTFKNVSHVMDSNKNLVSHGSLQDKNDKINNKERKILSDSTDMMKDKMMGDKVLIESYETIHNYNSRFYENSDHAEALFMPLPNRSCDDASQNSLNVSAIYCRDYNKGTNLATPSNSGLDLPLETQHDITFIYEDGNRIVSNITNNNDIIPVPDFIPADDMNALKSLSEIFVEKKIICTKVNNVNSEVILVDNKKDRNILLGTHMNETQIDNISKLKNNRDLKSKISVQGVEKPGGDDVRVNLGASVKTYCGSKKVSQKDIQNTSLNKSSSEIISDSLDEINLQNTKPTNDTHGAQVYCLCSDFGRLANYNTVVPYEHIHYWSTQTVSCDPKLLNSLHNKSDNVKFSSPINETINTNEKDTCSICWSAASKKDSNEENNMTLNSLGAQVPLETQNDLELLSLTVNDNNKIIDEKDNVEKSNSSDTAITLEPYSKKHVVKKKCYENNLQSNSFENGAVVKGSNCVKNNTLSPLVQTRDCIIRENSLITLSPIETQRDVELIIHSVMETDEGINEKDKVVKTSNGSDMANTLEAYPRNDTAITLDAYSKQHEVCLVKKKCYENNMQSSNIKNDALERGSNNEKNITLNPIVQIRDCIINENSLNLLSRIESQRDVELITRSVIETDKGIDEKDKVVKSCNGSDTANTFEAYPRNDTAHTALDAYSKQHEVCLVKKKCYENNMQSNNIKNEALERGSNNEKNITFNPLVQTRDCIINENSLITLSPIETQGDVELITQSVTENDEGIDEKGKAVKPSNGSDTANTLEAYSRKSSVCVIKKRCYDNRIQCENSENDVVGLVDSHNTIGVDKHVLQTATAETTSSITTDDSVSRSSEATMGKKRRISLKESSAALEQQHPKKNVKCDVCKLILCESDWIKHVDDVHNSVGWKVGENLDLNDEDFINRLNLRLNKEKKLHCSLCVFKVNHLDTFLLHLTKCAKKWTSLKSSAPLVHAKIKIETYKCGVCSQTIDANYWPEHIRLQHGYLAWKEEEPALDFDSNEQLRDHLICCQRLNGFLSCACGYKCIYAKSFLTHLKICRTDIWGKTSVSSKVEKRREIVTSNGAPLISDDQSVVCGACKEEVTDRDWIYHISKHHNYLAWKEGEPGLDLNNKDEVLQHLNEIIVLEKCLICPKCGLKRKYAKRYLTHYEKCVGETHNSNKEKSECDTTLESQLDISDDSKLFSRNCRMRKCRRLTLNTDKETSECDTTLESQKGGNDDSKLLSRNGRMRKHLRFTFETDNRKSEYDTTLESPKGGNDDYKLLSRNDRMRKRRHLTLDTDKGKSECDTTLESPNGGNDDYKVLSRNDRMRKRRRLSSLSNNEDKIEEPKRDSNELADDILVVCAVCKEELKQKNWIEHIEKSHYYLAWKEGDPSLNLNDAECVTAHLYNLTKSLGGLTCFKCNCKRKYVKMYLDHIQTCTGFVVPFKSETIEDKTRRDVLDIPVDIEIIKCGVCFEELQVSEWANHIQHAHNYIAWRDGDPPINYDDDEELRQHLMVLSKRLGGLICNTCQCVRKYPKAFLEHIQYCKNDSSYNNNDDTIKVEVEDKVDSIDEKEMVICGVCNGNIKSVLWLEHIMNKHNYLAWIQGEPPLNLKDKEEVKQHLYGICKKYNGLICSKCSCVRYYVKPFLNHIKACNEGSALESSFADEQDLVLPKESDDIIQCGVCKLKINNDQWLDHIENQHHYLSWIEGRPALNLEDKEDLMYHFSVLMKKLGRLICVKCDCVRRDPKLFLDHLEDCGVLNLDNDEEDKLPESVLPKRGEVVIVCGVCKQEVKREDWFKHIESEHNYYSWIEGRPPLNLEDHEAVRHHLFLLTKRLGGLLCSKCGIRRKYVKKYLDHTKYCTGQEPFNELPDTKIEVEFDCAAKCAVCSKDVQKGNWFRHIQRAHNYLAWREGEDPIDPDNEEMLLQHLTIVLRHTSQLSCPKCGFSRRYAKAYLPHIKACAIETANIIEDKEVLLKNNEGMFECAVCHENVVPKGWKHHAMTQHYNIAWVVGDIPIDLKSPYGTEKYLKEYKRVKGNLVCKLCGDSRVSLMGFYVHIITCNKTEEEIEPYRELCEICDQKYLGVYRSQHYRMHKEQEIARERKLAALDRENAKEKKGSELIVAGRRKAAEKATDVINNYKSKFASKYTCKRCGFQTDHEKLLKRHECIDGNEITGSDDELLDGESSDDESILSDASNASEECVPVRIRKANTDTTRPSWIPFKISQGSSYLKTANKDFQKSHFSDDTLYPEWRNFQYEFLESEEKIANYLPKLEKSCHITIDDYSTKYERFEGTCQGKIYSLFAGGAVHCISFAPTFVDVKNQNDNYLAVVAHLDSDCPRLNYDEVRHHPGLIQIWNCGIFDSTAPILELCIAHDYGTVWSIDWCPSGARDILNRDLDKSNVPRLGLLAVACSNGSAYILPIPYPQTVTQGSEKVFIKLKPVAELRFCMKTNNHSYQATSLRWSKKKGHAVIVVAYSDGQIAHYDLTAPSPLLTSKEDDVTIFYPYYDQKILNSSLSDLDTFPGVKPELPDAVCVASPTGVVAMSGGGCVNSRLPSYHVTFLPGWPSAVVSDNEGIVNSIVNEIDWHGCGRRLGPIRTSTGCMHCGRVMTFSAPVLRSLCSFPIGGDVLRRPVGIIAMKPLRRENRKIVNDELCVNLEPSTYEKAIQQYEINIKTRKFQRIERATELFSEKYPLADVTSIAFCTSEKDHDMLAVAIHAGLVVIFHALIR